MWKPPERIRFRSMPGAWPSATKARSARLFQPLSYQALQLNARTWVPAMVPWRAEEDGRVTDANVDWYGRFARGQPAALVVEATGIRDIPSGPLLRAGHDRYIEGLSRIVQRVAKESGGRTRLFIQLIDFLAVRRRPPPDTYFNRYLKLRPAHYAALGLPHSTPESALRVRLQQLSDTEIATVLNDRELDALRFGYREQINDTELPHIADLPQQLPELFAAAAQRVQAAGFDGVELHYAHAYTMASFLSRTNKRTDGYGTTLAGRQKLALEIINAVRAATGPGYVVGARLLANECIEGGSDVSDAISHAMAFAAAGLDFLSLSRGGKFDDAKQPKQGWAIYPYTGRSGYECMPQYLSDARGPFGRNLMDAHQIRQALRSAGLLMPVVVAGGIHNFEQAEAALTDEAGDVVGLARQALADPDWFRKVRDGYGSEVRLCEYTNYCEGLDQKHKQVTCQLWDRAFNDQLVARSHDGRRRLVAPDWQPVTVK